ncbi:NAD-dependent epimerase/dehydratase family protein [Phytomonospora endophytica]|uniref:Nucleoside-diphosphate-sugar epimerase n=1 Tax=Phytomonospora endophytica TaxID=714109 RepID=A0A841F990_9ACTN|nr:NAD-dependent epimerase/dehydratase family protein [Phytomonospora endophytica]MBB6032816.1 nucleoside-diphosphate-sugar epimerase [Phytomonospora endophytica]GIG66035.1 NAD-dependent dehydratase [Phytomonospora endophytica]
MPAFDAVVAGAGGFIGGHLVRALLDEGKTVRAVDIKPFDQWDQRHETADNLSRDVGLLESAREVLDGGAGEVYNLACNMGGMGFIETHKAECMLSVLPSTHMLMAARDAGVGRFFYSSSACVYAGYKQTEANLEPLKEEDAYPADAEDGYGWEKLFSERMCRHFREDFGLETRIARYHNIYGPQGTWDGGREKAPAAACRKVAIAALTGEHEVEIWGDGEQTRSFTYVDDCVHGSRMLTRGDFVDPLNVGSSEITTINNLYHLIADIAGVEIKLKHIDGFLGVRGRNSDNTLIQKEFNWEPSISLREGLTETYRWIHDQVARKLGK